MSNLGTLVVGAGPGLAWGRMIDCCGRVWTGSASSTWRATGAALIAVDESDGGYVWAAAAEGDFCGSGGVEDEQLMESGLFTIAARLGDGAVLEIEPEAVGDDILIGGDGDHAFPAIVEHGNALHGIAFGADDDIALQGFADEALLAGVVVGLELVEVILFARQATGGQVGNGGSGAAGYGEQQEGEHHDTQTFLHNGGKVTCSGLDVKLVFDPLRQG